MQPCALLAFSEKHSNAAGNDSDGNTLATNFCPHVPNKATLKSLFSFKWTFPIARECRQTSHLFFGLLLSECVTFSDTKKNMSVQNIAQP